MRIRKRKVPFPLSSLSPVPLSDLPFSGHRLQLHSNNPQHNQPNLPQNSTTFSSKQQEEEDEDKFLCKEGRYDDDRNGGEGGEKKISNDNSGMHSSGSLGAKTPTTTVTHELTYFLQDGKALIPLKKRRGSLKSNIGEITMVNHEMMKDKKIMKTKDVKKRARGGALMEGSRCSRVNGRGWRCCQPTLVGYSLCEHHLGKGRLRSMTSVRNRSAPNKVVETTNEKVVVGCVAVCGDDQEEKVQQQQQPSLLMSKKKHKLGTVKARSISSLLGQADKAEAEE